MENHRHILLDKSSPEGSFCSQDRDIQASLLPARPHLQNQPQMSSPLQHPPSSQHQLQLQLHHQQDQHTWHAAGHGLESTDAASMQASRSENTALRYETDSNGSSSFSQSQHQPRSPPSKSRKRTRDSDSVAVHDDAQLSHNGRIKLARRLSIKFSRQDDGRRATASPDNVQLRVECPSSDGEGSASADKESQRTSALHDSHDSHDGDGGDDDDDEKPASPSAHTDRTSRSPAMLTPATRITSPTPEIQEHLAPGLQNRTCPHCQTYFPQENALKLHMAKHPEEKPHICQRCNLRFRRRHDMKRHLKLHTGERNHVCHQCGRGFARGDALSRHTKGPGVCAGRRTSASSAYGPDGHLSNTLPTLEGSVKQHSSVASADGSQRERLHSPIYTAEPEGMDDDDDDNDDDDHDEDDRNGIHDAGNGDRKCRKNGGCYVYRHALEDGVNRPQRRGVSDPGRASALFNLPGEARFTANTYPPTASSNGYFPTTSMPAGNSRFTNTVPILSPPRDSRIESERREPPRLSLPMSLPSFNQQSPHLPLAIKEGPPRSAQSQTPASYDVQTLSHSLKPHYQEALERRALQRRSEIETGKDSNDTTVTMSHGRSRPPQMPLPVGMARNQLRSRSLVNEEQDTPPSENLQAPPEHSRSTIPRLQLSSHERPRSQTVGSGKLLSPNIYVTRHDERRSYSTRPVHNNNNHNTYHHQEQQAGSGSGSGSGSLASPTVMVRPLSESAVDNHTQSPLYTSPSSSSQSPRNCHCHHHDQYAAASLSPTPGHAHAHAHGHGHGRSHDSCVCAPEVVSYIRSLESRVFGLEEQMFRFRQANMVRLNGEETPRYGLFHGGGFDGGRDRDKDSRSRVVDRDRDVDVNVNVNVNADADMDMDGVPVADTDITPRRLSDVNGITAGETNATATTGRIANMGCDRGRNHAGRECGCGVRTERVEQTSGLNASIGAMVQ